MLVAFVRSRIGREWEELEFGDVVDIPTETPHDLDGDEDHEGDEQDEEEVWQSSSNLKDCRRSNHDLVVRSHGEIMEMYDVCIRSLAVINRTLEQIRITDRLIFRLTHNLFVWATPPCRPDKM